LRADTKDRELHSAGSITPHGVLVPVVRESLERPPINRDVRRTGLSFKSNFVWIFSGNVVYALCQWGIIVMLAKFGSTFMVGQFSLGLAISTPILMFSNLQLRAVQATDAKHSYDFRDYLSMRLFTTAAALALIVGIAALAKYERKTAVAIVAVAFMKGIDTLSDIHYGLFQQHDRLNEAGISMILRGVLALIVFSTGIYLTHDLLSACVGVTIAWLATLCFFDSRRAHSILHHSQSRVKWPLRTIRKEMRWWAHAARRHWSLARLAFPLGVVTTMAAVNLNVPRYFIHAHFGENQLGIFSALAYTTVAMTLVSDSLGHSGVPRMSRLYADGNFAEFFSVLFWFVMAEIILGLTALAVACLAGPQILTALYGKEYAAQSRVFTLLILGAAINCIASGFTTGITSARRFGIQVPLFGVVIGACVLCCARWIPVSGLSGGALATVYSATIRLLLSASVIGYLIWDASRCRRRAPLQKVV
jgi:O-antigen/teichoic acid export membrane protein